VIRTFVAQGISPILTAAQRHHEPLAQLVNAGIGLELSPRTALHFFIEARYQRISQYNNKIAVVPIRVGLRF